MYVNTVTTNIWPFILFNFQLQKQDCAPGSREIPDTRAISSKCGWLCDTQTNCNFGESGFESGRMTGNSLWFLWLMSLQPAEFMGYKLLPTYETTNRILSFNITLIPNLTKLFSWNFFFTPTDEVLALSRLIHQILIMIMECTMLELILRLKRARLYSTVCPS
jgi:hypothetical protein